MKKRCENPNDIEYSRYGGRGISVCDEWQDYSAFKAWALSHGYSDDLTLERVQPSKGYSPTNCCWILMGAQAFNKTSRRDVLRSDGALFPSVVFAARATGCDYRAVSNALRGKSKSAGGYGWKYYSDLDAVGPFDVEPDRGKHAVVRSDGEYFESAAKAGAAVDIPKTTFRIILKKGSMAKGYTWRLATCEEQKTRKSLRAA